MTVQTLSEHDAQAATRGFFFALGAYTFWGVQPIFMKAVAHIPATEVVAHRIIWSVPIAGLVLLLLGRTADLKAARACAPEGTELRFAVSLFGDAISLAAATDERVFSYHYDPHEDAAIVVAPVAACER